MAKHTIPEGLDPNGTFNEEEHAAEVEQGRLLFRQECEFLMGAVDLHSLPEANAPEVAFAGRSNVGKSSLLNALTDRKGLARTSNTPGRTQQLNFFFLGERSEESDQLGLYLVDLPGYGYAKVSKTLVKDWVKLMRAYLRGRPNLKRVFVLVDGRHGLKDSDLDIMQMMDETAVSYQIVLTKMDKVKAKDKETLLKKTHAEVRKHIAAHPEIIETSSVKGYGVEDLRAVVGVLAAT